jgi:hypothetical protein
MRAGTVSAVCVLLSSICTAPLAAAQSNPPSPLVPQASPKKLPAPAKLFELPRGTETGSVPLQVDSTNEFTNPPQTWMNLLPQQNRPSTIAEQLQVELAQRMKKGFLPQVEASRCTQIIIFQAPNMDSKMIEEVPREFSSNMPMLEGLPPCCRDFHAAMVPRNFNGLLLIAPRASFVAPAEPCPARTSGCG